LTGSASKGRTKHYSYYHCSDGCTFRFRADHINEQFADELKKYIPGNEMADLFKIMLRDAWHEQTSHLNDAFKELKKQIKEIEKKLSYSRKLLSSKQIEPIDYREIKSAYTGTLENLQAKLSASNAAEINLEDFLNKGINNMLKPDYLYETLDTEKKGK